MNHATPRSHEQRHEARASKTYQAFLRDLARLAGLSEVDGILAVTSVLTRLQQRMDGPPEHAGHMEAQLPSKLRELMTMLRADVERAAPRDGASFEAKVAADLRVDEARANTIIDAVLTTVRARLSPGELRWVARHLPPELHARWVSTPGPSESAGAALRSPAASAEHERLKLFLGRWHTVGQQLAGPLGPAAAIDLVEAWEWLPGDFFMEHSVFGHVGGERAAWVEVVGYEPASHGYPVRTFYIDGRVEESRLFEHGGAWLRAAGWNIGSERFLVRCTTTLDADGSTARSLWEHSRDGASWEPFWRVTSTREPAAAPD
ncbi:MAG: DUF2267 domain-containing protein [Myxococcota bacterium]